MKRTVPLLIAATVGFVLIFATFIPLAQGWGETAMIWFDILASIAFVLGGGNLLKQHLRKMSDKAEGWGFSVVTVTVFIATLIIGLSKFGVPAAGKFPDHAWSGDYIAEGSGFWWIYEFMVKPLTAMMFAMLAFYIASAAFRAFRAKNAEALLLLLTAFVVLLGRTYVAMWLTGWVGDPGPDDGWFMQMVHGLRLDRLTGNIMSFFNLAGNRAVMIGIALGIVSTSLKVLLGVDRSYLGSDGG